MKMGGIATEKDYPYEARNQLCQKTSGFNVNINGYTNLTSDENKLALWLVQNSPISVALNAFVLQVGFCLDLILHFVMFIRSNLKQVMY